MRVKVEPGLIEAARVETVEEIKTRLFNNYTSLATQPDLVWFEANVGPVLRALGHKIPGQDQDQDQGPKIPKDDFAPELFVDRFDYKLLGWSRPLEPSM